MVSIELNPKNQDWKYYETKTIIMFQDLVWDDD